MRDRLAAAVAPGRYQIMAAISAVHTSARDVRDTDWAQIVALYDQLADLLRRLGRREMARAAYDQAIELAGNPAETAVLTRRRDQLRPGGQ